MSGCLRVDLTPATWAVSRAADFANSYSAQCLVYFTSACVLSRGSLRRGEAATIALTQAASCVCTAPRVI